MTAFGILLLGIRRQQSAVVLLLTALFLAGCASGSRLAAFNVPKEQVAYLTVIRASTIGACCTIPLIVDDRPVVKLGVREYETVEIPAGERIAAIPKTGSGGGALALFSSGFNYVRFTAAPGEHVYVLMDHSFFEINPRIYPAGLGQTMLDGLRRVE